MGLAVTSLALPQSDPTSPRLVTLPPLARYPASQKMSQLSNNAANTDSSTPGVSEAKDYPTQYNLPPKKRADWKGTDMPSHAEDRRTVNILPGVIRHTSSPDSSLAYYYNYK